MRGAYPQLCGQLEKQREQAAKAKAKKAGLLTKTDGPAAEERKGLRMVEDSSSEEDEESKPEPSKKAGAPISTGGAAGFSLDRGAAVTALSTNRKTVGSSNAEKKLQMLGLSTEVDHSEPGGGGKKSKGRPVITEGESDDDEESGAVAVSPAAAGARGQESDEEEETNVMQSIDVSDIKSFVLMTIPRSQTAPVQCYIKRCRSGLQKLWPYYVLYSQDPDKFLLAGRRRKKNKQSTYLISTSEKELTRKSSCYIGKVKSNFVGTEFTMYDSGANPSDNKEGNEIRTELGVVQYDRNVLGTNGPRKMQVYLPSTDRSGVRDKLQPTQTSDCMTKKIENKDHNYIKIVNKTPRWNENLGAFCLNFQGRVTVASVKNFQLVDENDQDKIVLQFGKCSDDTFTMDYCYPMCALQAFAICMSSFDHKLACE